MVCGEWTGALLSHQDSFNLSTLIYIQTVILEPVLTYIAHYEWLTF
jgi:hypothetical protein